MDILEKSDHINFLIIFVSRTLFFASGSNPADFSCGTRSFIKEYYDLEANNFIPLEKESRREMADLMPISVPSQPSPKVARVELHQDIERYFEAQLKANPNPGPVQEETWASQAGIDILKFRAWRFQRSRDSQHLERKLLATINKPVDPRLIQMETVNRAGTGQGDSGDIVVLDEVAVEDGDEEEGGPNIDEFLVAEYSVSEETLSADEEVITIE